jgi:hypothetical protein
VKPRKPLVRKTPLKRSWLKRKPMKIVRKPSKRVMDKANPKGINALIKELDDIFSIFIRRRSEDEYGQVKCFTCNARMHWKLLDCGHFWSRKVYALRWHEQNCHPQCTHCNIFNKGNIATYAQNLKREYGEQILDALELKKNARFKLNRSDLQMLIIHYTQLNQMKK